MYGATGPYVSAILTGKLGIDSKSFIHAIPKPDFGGGHPDPNLTYAHHLVSLLSLGEHDFGAAFDGDGVSFTGNRMLYFLHAIQKDNYISGSEYDFG